MRGYLILGLLVAILIGCSGPGAAPSTSPSSSVAATAIAAPAATPTPSPASTTPPSASPAPANDFPADAMVRAVVPGISLRGAPGLSAETLGTLPADSRSSVVSGPVEADGYQWIQLAGPGLPPASGCATFPGPELSCPTWFGWAATGEPDASELSVTAGGVGPLCNGSIVLAMAAFLEPLTLAALVAATLEYAVVMRHREERRDAVRWQAELRESLVSVGRVGAAPVRRWTDEGTRLRADR